MAHMHRQARLPGGQSVRNPVATTAGITTLAPRGRRGVRRVDEVAETVGHQPTGVARRASTTADRAAACSASLLSNRKRRGRRLRGGEAHRHPPIHRFFHAMLPAGILPTSAFEAWFVSAAPRQRVERIWRPCPRRRAAAAVAPEDERASPACTCCARRGQNRAGFSTAGCPANTFQARPRHGRGIATVQTRPPHRLLAARARPETAAPNAAPRPRPVLDSGWARRPTSYRA